MKRFKQGWLLLTIGILLAGLDGYLSLKHSGYVEQVSLFERDPLNLRFGSGESEVIGKFDKSADALILQRSGREVLRIPLDLTDGTYRTHIGYTGGQICVFDGVGKSEPTKEVFKWNGQQFVSAQPDSYGKALLDAMAAADDGGTRLSWFFYFLLRPVIWIVYITTTILLLTRKRLEA